MGLRRCPDCRAKVSTAAPSCPHCGRPIAGVGHGPIVMNQGGNQFPKAIKVKQSGGCLSEIGGCVVVLLLVMFLLFCLAVLSSH